MNKNEYHEILNQALIARFGLVVDAGSGFDAHRMQRRLYMARDRARMKGQKDFDGLSIVLRNHTEIWIFKRDAAPVKIVDDGRTCAIREMAPCDVPPRPNVRGPSKPRQTRIPFTSV